MCLLERCPHFKGILKEGFHESIIGTKSIATEAVPLPRQQVIIDKHCWGPLTGIHDLSQFHVLASARKLVDALPVQCTHRIDVSDTEFMVVAPLNVNHLQHLMTGIIQLFFHHIFFNPLSPSYLRLLGTYVYLLPLRQQF